MRDRQAISKIFPQIQGLNLMKTSEKIKITPQQTEAIKVLIADDDPPTRILLRAAISQWGYEVVEASNGEEAWQILQQPKPPRLLILDWLMPKLDGISLCERIKQEQILHPYTILLTQVTGTTNIIKGLEAGADEFLSKPFNMAELRSRLSVGARIIRFENVLAEQNNQVQNYAAQMENLSQEHATQLVYHFDLLSLLGMLVADLAQELDERFTVIEKKPDTAATEHTPLTDLRQQLTAVLTMMKRLRANTAYTPKTGVCSLNELLQNAVDLTQSATRHFQLQTVFAEQLPPFSADAEQLQEVFVGLILSAAQALKDQPSARLTLQSKLLTPPAIQITLTDTGPPLTETELKILQQPHLLANDLSQIRSRLNLAMSKELVQKYGGSLNIQNLPGSGIQLTLHLPLQMKPLEKEKAH